MPTVSVVVPFRNAADTLPECLESIRRQTLAEHELIAVDDGSTDASPRVAQAAAEADSRMRLVRPGRVGLVAALNLGVAQARAPLIARMDADDLMHPSRLELQTSYLDRNPAIALIASRVELFPTELVTDGYREYARWQNACLSPEQIETNLYVESPLAHPSVTMRKHVFDEIGGYREGSFPE